MRKLLTVLLCITSFVALSQTKQTPWWLFRNYVQQDSSSYMNGQTITMPNILERAKDNVLMVDDTGRVYRSDSIPGTWSGGVIPVPKGGTGLDTIAQGDLLYGSSTDVISRLQKNDTSSRYLSNQGTSNNPRWDKVNLTNGVQGVLPAANGGNDGWQDWTPTLVGWAATPTTTARYYTANKNVFFSINVNGTSNSTSTTFTVPVTIGASGLVVTSGYVVNNGVANWGRALNTSTTVVTVGATLTSNTWTGSGTKQIVIQGFYEID